MDANRINSKRKDNPESLFDKAKEKHGFAVYDKTKDKISIEFLQSTVADLEQKNQDLEKKCKVLESEKRELTSEMERKDLEYNRFISDQAKQNEPLGRVKNVISEQEGQIEVINIQNDRLRADNETLRKKYQALKVELKAGQAQVNRGSTSNVDNSENQSLIKKILQQNFRLEVDKQQALARASAAEAKIKKQKN